MRMKLKPWNPSERAATRWRWLILMIYTLIIIAPAILSTSLGAVGHADDTLARIGGNLALSGFTMVCLQFVLSSRIGWIESAFGLDAVLRFHRKVGFWAGIFLLAHPLLMAAGEAGAPLLYATDVDPFIWLGRAGLLVLIIQILGSIYRANLRLPYETWRKFHNIAAWAVLLLGFFHSLWGGSSLEAWPLRIYWIVILATAIGANVWHKFLRPRELRKRPFRVVSVVAETDEVHTVTLEAADGGRTEDFLPGQFHFLTPLRTAAEIPAQEHPFTISSCPTDRKRISSSIKQSGDFTSRIPDIAKDDLFTLHGPFGRFSYRLHPEETRLLFIAGGIGITPLMSMLRHMRNTRRDDLRITLLYANKTEGSIAFRDELEGIASGDFPQLEIIHVLSKPDENWKGESGHISKDLLAESLNQPGQSETDSTGIYLCGPPAMMKEIKEILNDLGVSENRIHLEAFEF